MCLNYMVLFQFCFVAAFAIGDRLPNLASRAECYPFQKDWGPCPAALFVQRAPHFVVVVWRLVHSETLIRKLEKKSVELLQVFVLTVLLLGCIMKSFLGLVDDTESH